MKKNFDFDNMSKEERKKFHSEMKKINKEFPSDKATLKDVLDHIDYIVRLIGIDHVGIGSDFDGVPALPNGMTGCDAYPVIISLLSAKYSDNSVKKIAYNNFLRVLKDNE